MVKIWKWEEIKKRISPWIIGGRDIHNAALSNPRSLEFIASAVYCRNYVHLQEQMQNYYKDTGLKSVRNVTDIMERIIKRFRRKKKCHINFFGPRAGVRCYCAQEVE